MLKSLSTFDASFFGMLPEQVNKTDPQLRILLEVAYEAIVDAGKTLYTLIIHVV
ncbi:Fatty acid synthase [Holothuria leucospilota]|uniref:Fatty acid synthase n=1 Tax=Holothuria leucospilota TaxID=206669 RepID=A0A9Q1BPE9_HOLLE|nr:Fatty acid synthase [Holothuria leucospilota]